MKVFTLGGYGKTAIPAVKILVQSDIVSEIAIAGRNLERARKAAVEIGEKATAIQADGTDIHQMLSLLAGYDIVMNAAYNDTVLPVLHACIRTGSDYCDVAWGDLLKEAAQLDSEAITAGITAVVATGISPCISNLMGIHVARQLDEVEQLQIGRTDIYDFQSGFEVTPKQWLEDPKESLEAMQKFRPFLSWVFQKLHNGGARTVRVYQKDQWVDVDPIRNGMDTPLPRGSTIISYPYSSADDSWGTLPRNLSNTPPVEVTHSLFPPQLDDKLRELVKHMLEGVINKDTAVNSFYNIIERDPQHWLTTTEDLISPAKIWVTAVGRKQNRAARCCCWFTAPMWNVGGYFLTSVALAVAVLKILRGEVTKNGVMEAEKAFEPLSFFKDVAALLPELSPGEKMIDESFEWLESP